MIPRIQNTYFSKRPGNEYPPPEPTCSAAPPSSSNSCAFRPLSGSYSTEILQEPGILMLFYEYMRFFKIVPMGAPNRPHSDWNGEPTYMGDSIAWWDGDTLVVDTIGLNESAVVFYHSEALHTVERFTPLDTYRVRYEVTYDDPEVTYDDPKVFTKPWSQNWRITRHPTWKILEYDCQENNRCMGGNCTKADVQK